MTWNCVIMSHFKISITTRYESGRMVTRVEERQLPNIEGKNRLVTNRK
jgi:hypothetical protein